MIGLRQRHLRPHSERAARLVGILARGRSFESLGLREVAREANLNPNTFYRHFDSMEELALAAVEEITQKLREALRGIRRGAARHADATRGSAEFFIDFVLANRDAFVVGVREAHGASPAIRRAVRSMMDEVAREAADDIAALGLAPTADRAVLLEVAQAIVDRLFFRAFDYVERPRDRKKFVEESVRFARMLFIGAASAGG